MLRASKETQGYEPEDVNYAVTIGWVSARYTVEAIRLAVDKVGIENVTGKDVRDAMVTLRDLDLGFMPPIKAITEDKPWALNDMALWQVQGGKMVQVSDWFPIIPIPME